jgi:hypothetical protein
LWIAGQPVQRRLDRGDLIAGARILGWNRPLIERALAMGYSHRYYGKMLFWLGRERSEGGKFDTRELD